MKFRYVLFCLPMLAVLLASCGGWQQPAKVKNQLPEIFPDYTGVTVPCNIAPLNFEIAGAERIQALFSAGDETVKVVGDDYVDIAASDWETLKKAALSKDGKIKVEVSAWTSSAPDGEAYKAFYITVSRDEIDRYVVYRLIPPGYEMWNRMGIFRRDMTSFEENVIIENNQNNRGCVNCHSFVNYDANKGMVFHARGKGGGTMLYRNGKITKIAIEKLGPQKGATYPMWHPSGKFIIFSSNVTRQSFYGHSRDKMEVYDQSSDLILYDVLRNEVTTDERFAEDSNWETFPAFSPDGKWLYFCTAKKVTMPVDYKKLHYSICRVPFDEQTGKFGSVIDTVYNASRRGGSASFPRLSPDGNFLTFTWSECATFPIHHKEADFHLIDLRNGNFEDVNAKELNSPDVDSYLSWGSSGKWVIFSSKRIDGRYNRLFFSHWNGKHFSKPALLPQREPQHNVLRMFSYNIPEFAKSVVCFDKDEIASFFSE